MVRVFLKTEMFNPMMECVSKVLKNRVKPIKETHDSLKMLFEVYESSALCNKDYKSRRNHVVA